MLYLSYEEPDIMDDVIINERMVVISNEPNYDDCPMCGGDCSRCDCCDEYECECFCDEECD